MELSRAKFGRYRSDLELDLFISIGFFLLFEVNVEFVYEV